jgi:putative ABC transport system ATP-binding protein
LLGLAAGLVTPSDGEVHLWGEALSPLSEDARAAIRNRQVGFVFQSYRLIPTLTALENVMVPLEIGGAVARAEALRRATEGLEQVGMADRLDHYPTQLSGGEQQRVAIARAFVHQPKILFADEPTGNLDEDTSAQVESLLFGLNRDTQTALVLVTHDLALAAKCARHIRLKGGRLVESQEVA